MKLHKKAKRTLYALLASAAVLTASVQVGAISWFGPGSDTPDGNETASQEYKTVASNGTLELQMTSGTGRLRVVEKATNHVWRSWKKDELTEEEVNTFTFLQSNVESALMCTYFSKDVADASYQTIYSDECSSLTIAEREDGADVSYVFKDIGIEIVVQYRLEDNTLRVSIPKDTIRETGDNLLATISVAPFFGSGRDTDDGFVLLPDGSGTLVRFKEEHPDYTSHYEQSIFGSDTVRVEEDIYSNKEDVMLPVFGISNGGYAMTCDIREGAEDTNLVCWPSGYRLRVTSAYPTFQLRRPYYATLSNTSTVRKYSTGPISHGFSAVYTFLGQGKDSYSDMAVSYRAYLLENGTLQDKLKTDAVLALDIFMAAQESKMLSNEYIPVTTFSQAQDMLSELIGQGADNLLVQMTGWTKGGYTASPNRFPIPGQIGGASGSAAFSEFAEKAGIPVYYADDYLSADKEKGTVNLNTVVYQGNRLIAETDTLGTKYLFSPLYVKQCFEKAKKSYQKSSIHGLIFERMGKELYFDYNPKYQDMTRYDTAQVWQQVLKSWTDQGGRAAAQGGNAYVLPYTDWIRDIPSRDSGYFFRDETVPFYQMVVHGSVLYTGMPINLFSDSRMDYLKMIEYGCTPLFVLSHDSPQKLIASDYNQLFSSEFSQYRERIAQEYQTFSTDFAGISSQAMIGHQKVADEVYCTTYADGTQVYVNYGHTPYTDALVTVEGENYTIKGR